MNTSQIKTFAINSRQILKQGVINKISSLGFNPQGEPVMGVPTKIQGATVYAGKILDESFYDAWMALKHRIDVKGIKDVYEEAAYTWFNRLVAIRIMMKNGYIEPVLAYSSDETRIPRIVSEARAGHLITDMSASDRAKLDELLNDDSKTTEQFTLLIENFCRYNPVIYNCFGGIEKYISILLPDNILAQDGFVDLLNHTSYITDEDYTKSELIGWLYQFYIAEKKDEVFESFKKGKKAEAEDIPAATQIFTPNWIVKYMVQNTIGRIYLDNNPYSELGSQMKYLVGDNTPEDAVLHLDDLQDYKMIDPACGSGHILVEAFDLFYSMYREEGYSSRQAIENILEKNIIGIDLDTRAKQLATFALLMKAVKADESFLDCKVMPRVLYMPRPYYEWTDHLRDTLPHFYLGEDKVVIDETMDAFDLLTQADNLGSIMKFKISDSTKSQIRIRIREWKEHCSDNDEINEIVKSLELVLVLSDKYTNVVANPPYMSSSNMNSGLMSYVIANYAEGKADLMTVFMLRAISLLVDNGVWSMINLPSWMFLPSFDDVRNIILSRQSIDSLIYNGRGVFGSDFGSVSFVMQNRHSYRDGIYRKLFQIQGQVRQNNEIEQLFLDKSVGVYQFNQNDFLKVPGHAIAFWLPDVVLNAFTHKVSNYGEAKKGLSTGDNNRFLRLWPEVSYKKTIFESETFNTYHKWFPINKGGIYRKWYGNNEYLINWYNNGEEIKAFHGSVIRNPQYYLKPSLTWTMLSASCFGIRYSRQGKLFEGAGPSLFIRDSEDSLYILGYLCSSIGNMVLRALNPTINININDVLNLPIIENREKRIFVVQSVKQNIEISREDWDAHETSWDFNSNELISLQKSGLGTISASIEDEVVSKYADIGLLVLEYKAKWEKLFHQLHSNEENLNKQFIDIYNLQNELSPNIPLDEITILQQGEISIENNEIVWHDDVIIKQLISYAIGCWLGRFRLDKPGLHIAHPNPTSEEVCIYQYNGQNFEIDDDGIIPMMSCDSMFDDNGYNRIVSFIKTVFGEENLTDNLNFIEKALGKSLEDYMMKDFWKDHKKLYQNRPIYWLFSSKKGAFQCLVYMHRMNPYTAERVRTKYLLRHIEDLKGRITAVSERAAILTTVERKNLAKMQKDLDECLEYHDILHEVADKQIEFDLDDGVVVNFAKFGDVLAKIK